MTDELRQAFRLYDKEQHGYISTLVLKVTQLKGTVGEKKIRRNLGFCYSEHIIFS